MEVSRDGQPSAPGWLRIRAYSSPLARSAFGRVLSPPYAAVWPTATLSGGAWSSRVTPGQRRTPYAWSSGLLRYPACPRTYGLASSAGGKGLLQAVTNRKLEPYSDLLEPAGASSAHPPNLREPLATLPLLGLTRTY